MGIDTEGCKGCSMLEKPSTGSCPFNTINDNKDYCPCKICLIKGICASGCVPFHTFNDRSRTIAQRKYFHN